MSLSKASSKSVKEMDINIKLLEDSDEVGGYETSYCKLNIYGKMVNTVIVNTLRRVILTLIPIYSFNKDNINITKNTSVFNNDYMRLRLSNFPIYLNKELNNKYRKKKELKQLNVLNDEKTLERCKQLEYRATLGSAEVDITSDKLNKEDISENLKIVISVKNPSDNDIMNVMTNTAGVKYYYNNEQISHIYSNPLLIVQLQPLQEFACIMSSNLNIAMFNATYSPCSMCYFEEDVKDPENSFNFSVLSRRQISEKDILVRACNIIQQKLKMSHEIFISNISKYNMESYNKNKLNEDNISTEHLRNGTITMMGEQYTLGNLLSSYLQDHEDILFAGYKVGHPNVNQVEIKYECTTNILSVIDDVIGTINSIYETIKVLVEKMPDFGYKYI